MVHRKTAAKRKKVATDESLIYTYSMRRFPPSVWKLQSFQAHRCLATSDTCLLTYF
ncbi:hypothetical protein BVRB_9g210690 [Beta vulgaris subsp. vulgaris]|nr:hypothetical protein BVRB_9g210690 [Beta vulgaris subsp. vulgaris]